MPEQPSWYDEFQRLGDWITGVSIDGRTYGGAYRADLDKRVFRFIEHLKASGRPVSRILECGCLEGGHTMLIAEAFPAALITAVDVRESSLDRARFLMRLRQIDNVRFLQDDLDEPGVALEEDYDVVFCVGLLYHLKDPAAFLCRCAQRAPVLWLWTVYCAEAEAGIVGERSRGRIHPESTEHPLSGVRSESYFPTLGTLIEVLFESGYESVEVLQREMTENGSGPAVLLTASR